MYILWDSCIIVPPQGRAQILEELHESHTGAKMLVHAYIWWPKLDNDSEQLAKNCISCQVTSAAPPKAPLYHWEWPAQPYPGVSYILILQ